jgi:MFS family permease
MPDDEINHGKIAFRFIILLGIVSLLADMTYESARSITGPYLAILGASGAVVGFTAGAGELFGYGLRFFSGLLIDKTHRYWSITITGYVVNLLAVPLLALANKWEIATALIVTERIGKAIRTPARDVMLSHAAAAVGRGWGFAIHEAMDQIGAMVGSIIVMAVLIINGSYRFAFAILAIPGLLAITVLIIARMNFPQPHKLETETEKRRDDKLPTVFWPYIAAIGLIAAGFTDYPLIAFHIKSQDVFEDKWIPLLYSCAMGIDALSALLFGRRYDRKGLSALIIAIIVSSTFSFFAFSLIPVFIISGVVLWGIGMGAQESIIRAFVADIVPVHKRGTGFGLFNACFGIMWFIGSMLMGVLYDFSLSALIVFSVLCQVGSLPLLVRVRKRMSRSVVTK